MTDREAVRGEPARGAEAPGSGRCTVVVLHGGKAEGREPARPWQPAALRMRPFATALRRALPRRDAQIVPVRYRYRGWNGSAADPLRDTLLALDALAARDGERPVVLLGHSMGGRAALRAAGHPTVRGVVALAPWCPEDEPVAQLAGRELVIVHGDQDRVTVPEASWRLLARARAEGTRGSGVRLTGGEHTMLRYAGVWRRLAVGAVTGLLGAGPLPPEVAEGFTSAEPVAVGAGRTVKTG
ncbi:MULTISPECIES: alpha/beta hydrolase [unclassified Streptomyces]|uniref:alpha/beta hydrolase n=1 Tax=unclassified Streptomyces TaxID=2593676 RepID=UPI003CFCEEC2